MTETTKDDMTWEHVFKFVCWFTLGAFVFIGAYAALHVYMMPARVTDMGNPYGNIHYHYDFPYWAF